MKKAPSVQEVIIQEIIPETRNARTFVLAPSENTTICYQAGQFLTVIYSTPGAEEARRSYSFSSAPLLGEPPAITVKSMQNGAYSRRLMRCRVGDKLKISGVSGLFTLPTNRPHLKQFFFLAAGSGITPVFSLIKTLLFFHPDRSVILIYSNKSRSETIFLNELTELCEKFKSRFKIDFLFSDSNNLLHARLNNSLLVSLMDRHLSHTLLQETYFFLCGPFEYMDTAMITLLTEGVPRENIRKENFNSFTPLVRPEPPDKTAHKVILIIEEKRYELTVQYPDTILTAALKAKIPMPYSCQSGQCGSCVARCLRGNVWMSYNEVLTPKETDSGLTLTCMGFPVGSSEVVLQI